jgi:hypothetical protein
LIAEFGTPEHIGHQALMIEDSEIDESLPGLIVGIADLKLIQRILRWHRQLIAMKWTKKPKRTGPPSTAKKIEALIVGFARDNPRWGYGRIQGALYNLRHVICPNTVKRVQSDHGIEPAPKRQTTWKQFVSAHFATLAATDFFSTEVWTLTGLRTICILFVIDLVSRRIHIVGSTHYPSELFMHRAALALTGFDDSPLKSATHLIMDRDTKPASDSEKCSMTTASSQSSFLLVLPI